MADAEAEETGEKEISFKTSSGWNRRSGDKDDDENNSYWYLRKQAALTFDNICRQFSASDHLLPSALPTIEATLNSTEPAIRECGLLALGALALGPQQQMISHLNDLFPFLLNNTSDTTAEIRSITCWVLSRYSWWLFSCAQKQLIFQVLKMFIQ